MLNESSTSAVQSALANVGLTAFQVAVVQAKVFKQTLEEVSTRQKEQVDAQERTTEEQRQRVRESLATLRNGVDVVVGGSEDDSDTGDNQPVANPNPQGREVDIEV